jgi:hypothetical protein
MSSVPVVSSDITVLSGEPEKPEVCNPDNLISAPPLVPPKINPYFIDQRSKSYTVDYVYLTDGTGSTPTTLVQKGDSFLGLTVKSVKAVFDEYEDGSITYGFVLVEFLGDTEINAYLEYVPYDHETEFGGYIYVKVDEDSCRFIPDVQNRGGPVIFHVYLEDSDEIFYEIFGDSKDYVVDDCTVIVNDYRLILSYTDFMDVANIVRVVR